MTKVTWLSRDSSLNARHLNFIWNNNDYILTDEQQSLQSKIWNNKKIVEHYRYTPASVHELLQKSGFETFEKIGQHHSVLPAGGRMLADSPTRGISFLCLIKEWFVNQKAVYTLQQ